MDESIRRIERAAASGDPEARAALLRQRLRAGLVEQRSIRLAAHFGLPEALAMFPEGTSYDPISCSCRHNETRPACYRCGGTGVHFPPRDLILAVTLLSSEIGLAVLSRWASDAIQHVVGTVGRENFYNLDAEVRSTRSAVATISLCYRISGHSAVEREWQRRRLSELLAWGPDQV